MTRLRHYLALRRQGRNRLSAWRIAGDRARRTNLLGAA